MSKGKNAAPQVLVELSMILMGSNSQPEDQIDTVFDEFAGSELITEPLSNGMCIEGSGDWEQVSALIKTCYERVRAHSPHGYLRVAIR